MFQHNTICAQHIFREIAANRENPIVLLCTHDENADFFGNDGTENETTPFSEIDSAQQLVQEYEAQQQQSPEKTFYFAKTNCFYVPNFITILALKKVLSEN